MDYCANDYALGARLKSVRRRRKRLTRQSKEKEGNWHYTNSKWICGIKKETCL